MFTLSFDIYLIELFVIVFDCPQIDFRALPITVPVGHMPRGEGEGGASEIGGGERGGGWGGRGVCGGRRRIPRWGWGNGVGCGPSRSGLTLPVSGKARAKGASHGASVARLRRLHGSSLPSPS